MPYYVLFSYIINIASCYSTPLNNAKVPYNCFFYSRDKGFNIFFRGVALGILANKEFRCIFLAVSRQSLNILTFFGKTLLNITKSYGISQKILLRPAEISRKISLSPAGILKEISLSPTENNSSKNLESFIPKLCPGPFQMAKSFPKSASLN